MKYFIYEIFIYEIVSIPHKDFDSYIKYFIYEIFIYEIVSIPHKDFIYQIFHI